MLACLLVVDAVVIFEEDTPLELIKLLLPDVLVKGGDYTPEQIAGAKEVIANGGRVVINPILEGYSTTNLINRVKAG
jgi:D-beta-D-heptose 7-phosphate kinase/D-beta-D-heptose 1-phosphate adenosyltransferase